jgi:DNA-binding CsgD family transcriptional regulator
MTVNRFPSASIINAIGSVPIGFIAVDSSSKLIAANEVAQTILRGGSGLAISDRDILVTRNPALTRKLHGIVIRVATAALPWGAMIIPGSEDPRSTSLLVAPADWHDWSPGQQAQAGIFVTDARVCPTAHGSVIQELYGLTTGETKLVCMLLQNKSLSDAAAELHVGHETARTHLKAIFRKIGVRRQSELILHLLAGPAYVSGTVLGFGAPLKQKASGRAY